MKPEIKAALIAPAVGPLVGWSCAIVPTILNALQGDFSFSTIFVHILAIPIWVIYGAPISYASMFIIFLPIVLYLKKINRNRLVFLLPLGAVAGLIPILIYSIWVIYFDMQIVPNHITGGPSLSTVIQGYVNNGGVILWYISFILAGIASAALFWEQLRDHKKPA